MRFIGLGRALPLDPRALLGAGGIFLSVLAFVPFTNACLSLASSLALGIQGRV